jgi:hypothetical protein
VLSTRIIQEWQVNEAAGLQYMIFAAGSAFYGVQFAVLHRRREVWRRASWAAIQRHLSTELLFFYVVFTGSPPVSEPSSPHPSTLAQLPCAHPRAEIRSGLTLSSKRSRGPILPPLHRSRPTRDFIKAKP